jgi:predicted nucleotidyltransferase
VSGSIKQRRRKNGHPDPKTLADIVRRVVEAAHPDKIVLFGSAARGEMGPDSDIDLLVIKGGQV